MSDSPFRAGFGRTPVYLAGRDEILKSIAMALQPGSWSQRRVTLMSGFRGVGKTVTLNAVEDAARRSGWAVISETASVGFVDRIVTDHLPRLLSGSDSQPKRIITGGGIQALGSIQSTLVPQPVIEPTLRSQIDEVCTRIEPDAGLLFTLDEVNRRSITDLRTFATAFQHAVREDREVALVCCGLPAQISKLLTDESVTFLHRAARMSLDMLTYKDTMDAISNPVRIGGRSITEDALAFIAAASRGYPFLIQMIGDLAWNVTPEGNEITMEDARTAFREARHEMSANIHEPVLRDLSVRDLSVLQAAVIDDGPTSVSDLARRLDVDASYISMYRRRLIDAGVMYPAGHGIVDIAIPYLRSYLRDRAVDESVNGIAQDRAAFPPVPETNES